MEKQGEIILYQRATMNQAKGIEWRSKEKSYYTNRMKL